MPKKKLWTDEQLREAVIASRSYRGVIKKLGLIPAGGNYVQVKYRIMDLELDIGHFTGKAWNKGMKYELKNKIPLESLLTINSRVQSYKLKQKLFNSGIKKPECEMCGWHRKTPDGRIPVELDHINGNRYDNRIENLRILCPNCHSLQSTHRGKNKGVISARVVE